MPKRNYSKLNNNNNNNSIFFIIIIIPIFLLFYFFISNRKRKNRKYNKRRIRFNNKPIYINKPYVNEINEENEVYEDSVDNNNINKEQPVIIVNNNIDANNDNNLLKPPGRNYYNNGYVPINIKTRGQPNNYSQIGIITSDNDIKPLFGRQTYRGSNSWNYYTALDSHLNTKIPIKKTNKNCIEEKGCNELQNNDEVNISGNDNINYKVELYPYNDFNYLPY